MYMVPYVPVPLYIYIYIYVCMCAYCGSVLLYHTDFFDPIGFALSNEDMSRRGNKSQIPLIKTWTWLIHVESILARLLLQPDLCWGQT